MYIAPDKWNIQSGRLPEMKFKNYINLKQATCGCLKQDESKAESTCYPEDEAASYKTMLYRNTEAPELMFGCYNQSQLVGLIGATRYHGKTLTDESMNMHIPNGESVCIYSVAVHKDFRRIGIASRMLDYIINKVKVEQRDVSRILLICKSNLIPLYTRAGFILHGKSQVVHGKDTWYEMGMTLNGS